MQKNVAALINLSKKMFPPKFTMKLFRRLKILTMNEVKLKNLLGLAQRARLLVSGNFPVEEALNAGQVKAIILTTDASTKTAERFKKISAEKSLPLFRALTKETLGQCLGKDSRTVAAVLDAGFLKSIEKLSIA